MRDAAAVQSRLHELTRKFVSRTHDDVTQMREALARLEAGQGVDTGGDLELLRQLAHRACGTGGTLGFGSLSDAARELEILIDAISGAAPGAAERARIAAGLDTLEKLLP